MINQTAIVLRAKILLYLLSSNLLPPELNTSSNVNSTIPKITLPRFSINQENKPANDTRCYEPYGCFSISSPWNVKRPVVLFPEDPNKVNPNFCLYTNSTLEKCEELILNDIYSFYKTNIRKDEVTFFVVHGYLESGSKPWLKKMATELLKKNRNANVVIVDWSGGSGPPYAQAVSNIRLVGRAVALLITKLKETVGIDPERCHIIGHSLGAHTAGYAGYTLSTWNYKLGRITGMDPAEPYFEDTDPIIRLDPSDAMYVDVIHTDAAPFISGGFGLRQPVGHVDFYPNGGESQPGCSNAVFDSFSSDRGLYQGIRKALGCNHIRSYEYFTESINTACDFLAVECESYEKFEAGECFSCPEHQRYNSKPACSKLGLNSKPVPPRQNVAMFLKTAESAPFCRHHYLIELVISNSSKSIAHGGEIGEFYFEFHGKSGHTERLTIQEGSSYFEPGSRRRRVVPGNMVGKLEAATVEWNFRTTMWNPLTWRITSTSQIFLESLSVQVLETGEKFHLCTDGESLLSATPKTFYFPQNTCRPSNSPIKSNN